MSLEVDVRGRVGPLEVAVQLSSAHETTVIIGPNGSGKTSLLRMLTGALRPISGTIRLGDRVLFDADRGVCLPPEHRRIGYVPQGYALFSHLTAVDNVAFGLAWSNAGRSLDRKQRKRRARDLLSQVGIEYVSARKPHQLSGGEKQRVALARALAVEPELMLLDEPLSALDATARGAMRTFLADRIARIRRPALVVSHDVRDALALRGQILAIEAGQVVQRGTLDALVDAPATAYVEEYVAALRLERQG